MEPSGEESGERLQFWSKMDADAGGNGMPRLFCLPHAGSGAAGFYRWKRALAGRVAVCPVKLPGRELRMGEAPLRSIGAMVEGMHGEMVREAPGWFEEPYAVFGHSMSALTALEWVRRIQAEGWPLPVGVWVSGRNGPRVAEEGSAVREICGLPDGEFLRELGARFGGADRQELLRDEDLRTMVLPMLRADVEAVERYRFVPGERLRCAVRAVAGMEDRSVSAEGLERWREVAVGSFEPRRVAGDHFCHFGAGQAELLEEFVRVLVGA